MTISQLQNLVKIPAELRNSLGGTEFSTCWYGSAGLDFRLLHEINRLAKEINYYPRVFFFTDEGYNGGFLNYFNELDREVYGLGNDTWKITNIDIFTDAKIQRVFFETKQGECKEGRLLWLGHERHYKHEREQFIFLINCTNQFFEKVSIELGLEYEIVCEGGGMSGSQRPLRLGDLGAKWSLGHVPRFIGDDFLYKHSDNDYQSLPEWTHIPFYSEHVLDSNWGCNNGTGYPLRKVISIDRSAYSSAALAVANAVQLGFDLNNGARLKLDHLTEIESEAAEIIAGLHSDLSLNGIFSLGADVARILGSHHGTLSLNGLTHISEDIASGLASHTGDLHLDGLLTLSAESARILSAMEGDIFLCGLKELIPSAAEALSGHRHTLHLNSIKTIDEATAMALSRHPGAINLRGITCLSDHIASNLAHRQDVKFGKLCELSVIAAEHLAHRNASLELDNIKDFSPEVAKALANNQGTLHLNGIASLLPESAQSLSTHVGTLSLGGIKVLESCVARYLFNHRGLLILSGVDSISDDIAKSLIYARRNYRDRDINYTHSWSWNDLGIECSCILIKSYFPIIDLKGQVLSNQIAEIISKANLNVRVFLKSCAGISMEAVDKLSKYKGEMIFDGGTLIDSPEFISTLANLPFRISLPDFKWGHIDANKALLLLKTTPHWCKIDFKNATSLSMDALRILATHRSGIAENPAINQLCCNVGPYLNSTQIAEQIAALTPRNRNIQKIMLQNVCEISEECARILSKTKAKLHLDGLKKISPQVLEILSNHRGTLSLPAISSIDPIEAGILARHRGPLFLNHIKHIDLDTLLALSSHVGLISLDRITSVSDRQAEIISEIPSPVSLKGVVEISDYALSRLAKKRNYKVRLNPNLFIMTTQDFKDAILAKIQAAKARGADKIPLRSGQLQTEWELKNKLPPICDAMKSLFRPGDRIQELPKTRASGAERNINSLGTTFEQQSNGHQYRGGRLEVVYLTKTERKE